ELLNQVAAAKLCLLNPTKKSAYDRRIKATMRPKAKPSAAAPAKPPSRQPVATVAADPGVPAINTAAPSSAYRERRKKASWQVPAALALATVVVVGLAIMLLRNEDQTLRVGQGESQQQGNATSARPTQDPSTQRGTERPDSEAAGSQAASSADPQSTAGAESRSTRPSVEEDDPEEGDASVEPINGPETLADLVANGPEEQTPDEPDDILDHNLGESLPAGPSQPAPPPGREKTPIPAEPDRERALAAFWKIYREEYDDPKPVKEKQNLAKKWLHLARLSTDDPASRYVTFEQARDLATKVKDGVTAYEAVDGMAAEFLIDPLPMKAKILEEFSRKARWPAEYQTVANQAFLLMDEAIRQDAITLAGEIGQIALDTAREAAQVALG
ncbi:hypothetical protein LCGC14_2900780, partial [marine sediment metagenome]